MVVAALLLGSVRPGLHAAPRPQLASGGGDYVVLLHGLGRSKMAMWPLALRLRNAGYRAELVGYRSMRDTPDAILRDIARQIVIPCRDSDR